MIANVRSLIAHSGPEFEHWRRQCMRAFGLAPVDGPSERE